MFIRCVFISLVAAFSTAVSAQGEYPSKPIRLIVPYGPGGGADTVARPLAQQLSEQLGQQVVVENRSGASGTIGSAAVANAAPDGYTLLINFSSLFLAPLVMEKPPFDPEKAFTPVGQIGTVPQVIVVHPSLPVTTTKELIDYASKNPGQLSYVTAGTGTQQHLTGESFARESGVTLTHVAYKGGGQAMSDLLGGHVKMGVLLLPTVLPQIESGKLRPIAVVEDHRTDTVPDVPTVGESGVPGFAMPDMFIGLFGPAGTPEPIVSRLNSALSEALQSPDLLKTLEIAGYKASPDSPDKFATKTRDSYALYRKLLKEIHLVDDSGRQQ